MRRRFDAPQARRTRDVAGLAQRDLGAPAERSEHARAPKRIGAAFAAVLALAASSATLLVTTAGGQELFGARAPAPAFEVVDVYVDSERPLAAWQFELEEADGRMQVVGIEGGEAVPFADAPYYDRTAVEGGAADRIIVASFSTLAPDALPVGRTRVASVHVRLAAGTSPDYRVTLIAAGAADGRPIDATISFDTRNGRPEQ